MMEKLKVEIMNFNCTFGNDSLPLLAGFNDYFFPAIDKYRERVYKKTDTEYIIAKLSLYELEGRLVLAGIFVEKKTYMNKTTKFDSISREFRDEYLLIETNPVSFFGIFLDNHRMYYIKNQSESPSVEKFRSSISYALKKYRKERRLGEVELNINVIPSEKKENYEEMFSDVQRVEYIKFKLFNKNATDFPGDFLMKF